VSKILRSSFDVDAGEMGDGREGLGCMPDARDKLASCRALQLARGWVIKWPDLKY